MFDMIEKLNARRSLHPRIDVGVTVVFAWVEHFAHGAVRIDFGVTHLGCADGLDELRGEQRITLNAFGDHETRGDIAQPQRYGRDDQKTAKRKPAQQIELPAPASAGLCRCARSRYFL